MLNPEHLLVPFETAELPAGPWLVFAPHADDETFGMGGSLLRARAEHIETHIIVLTDGALGGEATDLVAIRRGEVHEAANLLGAKSLTCWTEKDRELAVSDRLIGKIKATIDALRPSSVFFPAALELHPDHRVTAQLVWRALQAISLESSESLPTAYGYEISVQSPINCLIDISVQCAQKERVMAVYCSQNSQNNYQQLVLALDTARTFTLAPTITHAEGFCRYTLQSYSRSLRDATQSLLDLYW